MRAITRVLINEIDEIDKINEIYKFNKFNKISKIDKNIRLTVLLLVRMNDIILISSPMPGMLSGSERGSA